MSLSNIAADELAAQIAAFLDAARGFSGRGDFDAAAACYDFPLTLVSDGETRMLDDHADLRRHLEGLAAVSAEHDAPVWHQEIVDVRVITKDLAVVTADVRRVDLDAKPAPPQRQSLVLRRASDGFHFAAIINPIRSGYWNTSHLRKGN